MADIRRRLQPDEELIHDLHPHWRRLVVPFVAVPVVAAGTTFALLVGPVASAYRCVVLGAAIALLLVISGLPYLRWRTTRYLVTDRRIVARSGIVTRIGCDVPLYRLDGVHVERTLTDRLTRSGDLILDGAGEQGQIRFVHVPRVEEVQRSLSRLTEAEGRRRPGLPEYGDELPKHAAT